MPIYSDWSPNKTFIIEGGETGAPEPAPFRLCYRLNDVTTNINLYYSISDVGSNYACFRVSGETLYAKLGSTEDEVATRLRVKKSGIVYAYLSESSGTGGGPIATLSNKPATRTPSTTTDMTVGGVDVISYKYKLDNGTYGDETLISSHIQLSSLTETSHTIYVLGKNSSNVWQTIPTTYAWTVDYTAPVATLSGLPNDPTLNTSIDVTVSGNDVISYKYKLDDGTYSSETSIGTHIQVSDLSLASHTLYVIGKDTAGNWKPENEATTYTWTISASDAYTTLLLHMEGDSWLDSSAYSNTVTPNGNAVRSTAQYKFGSQSAYLDGSGDFLSIPYSTDLNFGSGDFTIDWWEYRTATPAAGGVYYSGGDSTHWPGLLLGYSGVNAYASSNGSSWDIFSALSMGTVVLNAWVHRAMTRSGNTFRTFQNGNYIASATSSAALKVQTGYDVLIGKYVYSNTYFKGYIDELRVSKGIARWTSSFTPPNAPY